MKTILILMLMGMASALRASPLSKCTEEDVCQSIIFNQLALAELKEEMTTMLRNFNFTAISGDSSRCERIKEECMQRDQNWNQEKHTLVEKVANLNSETDHLQTQVTTQQQTIETKEETISQKDQTITRLTTEINEFKASIVQLQTVNSQLQKACKERILELERQIEQLIAESITEAPSLPRDCLDLQAMGKPSGVYTVYGDEVQFEVLCDMDTEDGGWTLFFARQVTSDPVDFNENWENFKHGFGSFNTEFWLGNEILHILTSLGPSTMRVDAESFTGDKRWAEWNGFNVDDEDTKYLMTLGEYDQRSTLGDSLSPSSNNSFTTYDDDNDRLDDINCALGSEYARWAKGGWWYKDCGLVRPTGPLINTNSWDSACWLNWDPLVNGITSIKTLSMKIKRNSREQVTTGDGDLPIEQIVQSQ